MASNAQILDLIRRYAQEVPQRSKGPKTTPATTMPTPGATHVPIPQGHKSVAPAGNRATPVQSRSVRYMQQAIQDVLDAANGNPEFTSYLISNYHVPSSVSKMLKSPISMDSNWGAQTTRFLFAAGWLATSINSTLNTLGGVAPNSKIAFRDEDIQQLKELLPRSLEPLHESPDVLAQKAEALTKILNKLTVFYQNYSKQVMQNDVFKQVTNKDHVVLSLMPGVPANVQDKFGKYLNNDQYLQQSNIAGLNLPNAQNKMVKSTVNLLSLSNPLYFQNFLKQYLGYSDEQAQDVKIQSDVLGTIQQQINARLSQSTLTPPVKE